MAAYPYRSDTKLYRLHTPQRPVARTRGYRRYWVDEYPLGTNAVVAVLAHTGYDMEDAMIINKAALDRGFAHGTLVKCETVVLKGARVCSAEQEGGRDLPTPTAHARIKANQRFGRGASDARDRGLDNSALDADGLPAVGSKLVKGSAVYSVVDGASGLERIVRHKGEDAAYVAQVVVVSGGRTEWRATIKLLYNRTPVTGDKFSR